MVISVKFGTRGLYRTRLLRLPQEANAMTAPDQFTGDAIMFLKPLIGSL